LAIRTLVLKIPLDLDVRSSADETGFDDWGAFTNENATVFAASSSRPTDA
jgi:hypothetical protein